MFLVGCFYIIFVSRKDAKKQRRKEAKAQRRAQESAV
jgi:hypothetical protein